MIEGVFPFLILNGCLITYYFSRKLPKVTILRNVACNLLSNLI